MENNELKNKILETFEYFRSVQGKRYDSNDVETKEKLGDFRKNLIDFTNNIFKGFKPVKRGNGQWQHGGRIANYICNKYKPFDNNTNLVIFFCAAANINMFYVAIGCHICYPYL